MALAGGIAVAVGALLPWLTLYGGLHPMRGIIGLYGWLLLSAGVVSVLLVSAAWRRRRIASRLLLLLAFATLGFSSWIAFAEIPATLVAISNNPFLVAGRGPGPYVIVAGSLLLVLAAAVRIGTTAEWRHE